MLADFEFSLQITDWFTCQSANSVMLSLHFVNVYPPGRSTSGLFHFARELAAHVGEQGATTALSEAPVERSADWWNTYRATSSEAASVVLVYQFSPHLFGRRDLTEFASLLVAHRAQGRRVMLVWHDANARETPDLGRTAHWSYVTLPHLVNTTCLFSEGERLHFPSGARVSVIPHFIRTRPRIEQNEARHFLNLRPDARIGGVLGFIHPRKGPDRAFALLSPGGPLDELVFAGQFLSEDYEQQLRSEVQRRNLQGRVHFTGYLPDEMFAYWANACDVGLCPFVEVSASGSLSDWFALRKPVVAHELPQLDFYKRRAGEGLTLVDTTTPEPFRRAVEHALQLSDDCLTPIDRLVQELAAPAIARSYVELASHLSQHPKENFGSQLRRFLIGQAAPADKYPHSNADGQQL